MKEKLVEDFWISRYKLPFDTMFVPHITQGPIHYEMLFW
jgi:hypothetical protein